MASKSEDLQNEEGINNAYAALAIEEEGVEKHLRTLLAQQGELESKVREITKAIPNLEAVHSDAVRLADMISFTSNLAENVSAKVRRLDIARGRVSECQQRVHDLLDLQLCSEGVETALGAEDYEKAAAHVHRFLSMDTNILKQTADDMQQDCTSVSNSVQLLREAADKLRDIVTLRFNEAVHDEDLASVERFFKIFPLLGMHDYGLEKYSLYLSSKLEESSRKNLKIALNTSVSDKRANVIYADTLTLLFEGVARVVEIHQPLVETYYGPGRLLTLVLHLQSECDRQSKAVLGEFRKQRLVERRVAQVRLASGRTGTTKLDPLELDVLLGEITIMHSRYNLYLRFIRRRITADVDVGMSEASDRTAETHQLDSLLEGCELCRLMQELLGHYLPLEHYYMEESVKKAIAMDQLEHGSNTSSMVDDVFFIVRKCIRRASGSGSLDGVCAVINTACAVLETEMCSALTQQLRLGFPSGYLDLTQAYNVVLQGRLQPSDSEHAKNTFLAYLNNADLSGEYVGTLCPSLVDEEPTGSVKAYLNNADVSGEYVGTLCRSLVDEVPTGSTKERTKLESCLAGLSTVTAAMGAATELGLQQLRVSAVKPRVAPWVDGFLALSHNLSEEDFSSYEANDPFVRSLITNLDGLLSEFKHSLTPTNYDALVTILVIEVTSQMEKVICKTDFNRLGGLALDKEVRSLSGYLSSSTSWSVRDKFSRLSQIATILNLERVAEMSDYWDSSALPWRLTPNEVKRILKLRIDFRSEDIARLKL